MGKRFGRNQRRKLREENEQLMNTCMDMARDRAAFEKLAHEFEQRMADWAQEVRYLLGENSAFNETLKRVRVRNLEVLEGRLRLSDDNPYVVAGEMLAFEQSVSVIEAFVITARLEPHPYKPLVTVIIEDRFGNTVGLAVDRARLNNWSPRIIHETARTIVTEIARSRR